MSVDVLAIGDLTVDQIFGPLSALPAWGQEAEVGAMEVRLGGNTGNFALAAASLGLDVACAGPVGDDAQGAWIRQELARHGLSAAHLDVHPDGATSVTTALVRDDGERLFVTYPGVLGQLAGTVTRGDLPAAELALFSGWCQPPRIAAETLLGAFERLRNAGVKVAIDLAWSDASWTVADDILRVLSRADIALMNQDEARALSGEGDALPAAGLLRKRLGDGVLLLIKCGPAGVVLCEPGAAAIATPAVAVVDPLPAVGTGDSFNAGFLHGLIRQGLGARDAVLFGSAFAAWQLMHGRGMRIDAAAVHALRDPASGGMA